MSADVRPAGPLVWIHGASVGEVLAAAALIERLRALNLRILLTSGTVTSAAIVAKRFPADVIHQYVPYDSPRYVARFLDHWRPSLALFIESDLWPNLILSSAARRLPMVLINGRMSQRSFPRWRRVAGHHLGAARQVRRLPGAVADRCRSLCGAGQPQRRGHGQSQARRSGAAGRLRNKLERLMSMTRGRPVVRRGLHPSRRGRDPDSKRTGRSPDSSRRC